MSFNPKTLLIRLEMAAAVAYGAALDTSANITYATTAVSALPSNNHSTTSFATVSGRVDGQLCCPWGDKLAPCKSTSQSVLE